MSTMRRPAVLVALPLALFLATIPLHSAQEGVTVCACQPDAYTFALNFSLTCGDFSVSSATPGINETYCAVNPVAGDENVTDRVPVEVSQIQILELGPLPASTILNQTTLRGDFLNGATFEYTSVSAQGVLTPETNPTSIQITLTGKNQDGKELINFWTIFFNPGCDIFPLLSPGMDAGWTTFVSCNLFGSAVSAFSIDGLGPHSVPFLIPDRSGQS